MSEWIALAREELAAGSAGRALFLGRELHWVDADEWRKECTELLVGAYQKLDRGALADIVKIHHQLDLVLDLPTATEGADAAAAEHLHELQESRSANHDEHPSLRELAEMRRAAVVRLFERRGARGKAFAAALASDSDIRAAAIEHADADLVWRSPRDRTVLHLAAAAPSLDAVRALLDRGIDPLVRDKDGQTAFDATRTGRERNPREATGIFELLDARGGGPAKAPVAPRPEWLPGTAVMHTKFGAGVVEAVAGTGDQTKLTIAFADATKVLVAKSVTRV